MALEVIAIIAVWNDSAPEGMSSRQPCPGTTTQPTFLLTLGDKASPTGVSVALPLPYLQSPSEQQVDGGSHDRDFAGKV